MGQNLTADYIRSLLSLSEKRDALLAEFQKIETEITNALSGGTAPEVNASYKTGNGRVAAVSTPKAAKGKKASAKRGKRGALKELILTGLKEAGEAGIAVKHLAAKLAIKQQNLHVWFHTTGKKSGKVEAAGKGVYRLKKSAVTEPVNSPFKAPKKVRRSKAK